MFLKFIEQSAAARIIDDTPLDDEIHVILQYFEHANPERDAELKLALRCVCEHPLVTAVHLLNERIYDDLNACSNATQTQSLGWSLTTLNPQAGSVVGLKIRQYCLGTRLKFKDVFKYLREHQVRGYYVIINSDICFDETLENLRRSDLHVAKKMMSPLRYEVLDTAAFAQGTLDVNTCPIFGPRIDSQDAWIFHSYQMIPEKFEKLFNFQFGKPGCDNKMIYLMRILGYDVVNDPAFVKTYHVHASQDRNYTAKDSVPPPYAYLGPYGYELSDTAGYYLLPSYNDVDYEHCNRVLRKYVERKLTGNQRFVIPCICPENNTVAVMGRLLRDGNAEDKHLCTIKTPPQGSDADSMRNGVKITAEEAIAFSEPYLAAFEHCDLFAGWESYGHQVRQMEGSHDVMLEWYSTKTMIWAQAFEIFHYIYRQPWTQALRGKRILVVSPLADQMRRQNRKKLYDGVDLFPDCEFQFCSATQTQEGWSYDVALTNSNAECNAIYESGGSAICVGPVLPMYFGIYEKEWLRDRPDVVRLFLNEDWIKA